jgi:WD40 repeat protein
MECFCGTLISELSTAANSVYSVAISPDGSALVDGGLNNATGGVLEVWNASTGVLTSSLSTTASLGVSSVAFSPNGINLMDGGSALNSTTGVGSGVLETWKTSSWTLLTTSNAGAGRVINSVAISPDGTILADGGSGAGIDNSLSHRRGGVVGYLDW